MQKTFVKYLLAFFVPIIGIYSVLEYYQRHRPSTYQANSQYLLDSADQIQIVSFGSSQAKDAINPEWIDLPLLNMASGNQHHNSDLALLKGLKDRLPNLKAVIFEVSYSHFEMPHNEEKWWKKSAYLHFYGINTYKRTTWFKDRLLVLSNPSFFSKKAYANSTDNSARPVYNKYGFDTNNYGGQFMKLAFDSIRIDNMKIFKINTTPSPKIFEHNARFFKEMVAYARELDLDVIISHIPMYRTYHRRKHTDILRRRDSMVKALISKDQTIRLFDLERDTLNFYQRDYWNQSHLNPKGARKFSDSLNKFLNSIYRP